MTKGPAPEYLPWIREVAMNHHADECLQWPFFRGKDGYSGVVRFEGRTRSAHSVVCELTHGPAPKGKVSAHSCGMGHEGCVSKQHLRWRTNRENHLEKWDHGTGQFGESHGRAKLTEGHIRAIRRSKQSQRVLADAYGVSQSTVWAIINRETWSHI